MLEDKIIEEIHELAYYKWMQAGCTGDSLTHWAQAEEEVMRKYFGDDTEDN